MRPYYEEDDNGWMQVSYRRHRRRNENGSFQSHNRLRSSDHADRQPRTHQRSYASAVRTGGRRLQHLTADHRQQRQRDRRPFNYDSGRDRNEQQHHYFTSRSRSRWENDNYTHQYNKSFSSKPVRQRRFNGAGGRNFNRSRQRQPARERADNWIQLDDPDFVFKIRIIHRIIKAHHHLANISGDVPPPTIRRTALNLATFIKPASPSESTQTLLEGNALNWEYTAVLILKQHCEDSINNDIQDLAEFPTQEWEGPFQVAASWAKRNLGHRLLNKTLDHAKA